MGDDEVDMQELARMYCTDPDTLDPEVRERNARIRDEIKRKRAAGEVAPPRPGDNFAIGLDDNFNPLPPVPPRKSDSNQQDQE